MPPQFQFFSRCFAQSPPDLIAVSLRGGWAGKRGEARENQLTTALSAPLENRERASINSDFISNPLPPISHEKEGRKRAAWAFLCEIYVPFSAIIKFYITGGRRVNYCCDFYYLLFSPFLRPFSGRSCEVCYAESSYFCRLRDSMSEASFGSGFGSAGEAAASHQSTIHVGRREKEGRVARSILYMLQFGR